MTHALSRLAGRLAASAVVVFAVFTLSFALMRLAPGSPFDAEKELPAAVVANQAEVTGMAAPVRSPHDGTLVRFHVDRRRHVGAGEPLYDLRTAAGAVTVHADAPLTVFRLTARVGEPVAAGGAVLFAETSLVSQYLTTLASYAQLDFGVTFDSRGERTVWENLRETFPVSAELGLYALLLALLLGVPAGFLAGARAGSWTDHAVMGLAMLGQSIPTLVLGPLLILVVIMQLGWLPAHGGWESGLFVGLSHKLLPALTLGLAYAAWFARLARAGMLEVIGEDWIRTARAKGLPERLVLWRHAVRGAILPVVSFLGPAIASLLVGSVVVETVFQVPGVSKYFVSSALNRDYPMVMGVVVLYSGLLVLLNLLVDLAYVWLDPRVRRG